MHRRIFGIETEYGLNCASTDGGAPPMGAEEAARVLFDPLVARGRSTNVFLPNGGRLYLDVGAHPEYATAECDSLWDLLAQVRAGSAILGKLAVTGDERLVAGGVAGELHLFANNLDSSGNSYGCHENYMLRRSRDFREMADALIAFFVTRQIVAGAGAVVKGEDGRAAYSFSARADQIHDALSGATTRTRPIINTRDEPLSDSTSYRRLHVIVGDTNMAEPTTALKVASTDAVLHAMENGVDFSDLALADPMQAIRVIATDLDGSALLELSSGASMTSWQIQQEIMIRALEALDDEDVPELYRYLFDLWRRAIDAVRTRDWEGIDTEIDFAVKKKLVDAYRARTGAALDDTRVTRLILAYHDITRGGLLPRLEGSGLVVRLTTPEQVRFAESDPPATTRAALRGRAIAAAEERQRDLGADWVTLRLEGAGVSVSLQDPFATSSPQVDALIAQMAER